MQMNASGVNTFQHRFISWSTRRRGSVQRIHICIPTRVSVFNTIHNMPQAVPVVQFAKCAAPILGNGVFQAPRNNITLIIDTKNIMEYSEKNTKAKRIPVNSVWKPATSSDSASGISNGARLLSASEAMNYITNAISKCGARKIFQLNNPPILLTSQKPRHFTVSVESIPC